MSIYIDGVLQGGGGGAPAVPGFDFIEEKIISGGPLTSFDFDAVLDGDADGGYLLVFKPLNPINAARYYHLRLNGAIWAVANNTFDGFQVPGGHVFGSLAANPYIARDLGNADPLRRAGVSYTRIPFAASGQLKRSYIAEMTMGRGTLPFLALNIHSDILTPAPATPITSMGVMCTNNANGVFGAAAGIGDGTRAVLYKTGV